MDVLAFKTWKYYVGMGLDIASSGARRDQLEILHRPQSVASRVAAVTTKYEIGISRFGPGPPLL